MTIPKPALAAGLLFALFSLPAAFLFMSWWIDGADEPEPADLIVVLAGLPSRPLYAAELYAKGLAPEVWTSRPYRRPDEQILLDLGVRYQLEEDLNREILEKKGVPKENIHLYGNGVVSTFEEALALSKALDVTGKTLLIVTSRWHARRARLIFRRALPDSRIIVAGSPHESFTRRWWRDHILARSVVMEAVKTLYYALGGRSTSVI